MSVKTSHSNRSLLNLRASSWVLSYIKGNQIATLCCSNNTVSQLALSYTSPPVTSVTITDDVSKNVHHKMYSAIMSLETRNRLNRVVTAWRDNTERRQLGQEGSTTRPASSVRKSPNSAMKSPKETYPQGRMKMRAAKSHGV